MFQELTLLDCLQSKFKDINLSKVVLVSCQHVLQSNYITLEYLFNLGLKPENVFLLGKAYSSNKKVAEQLASVGVHVHPHSFSFNSHEGYDFQFEKYTTEFILETAVSIGKLNGIDKIIVLDDGGYLISKIQESTFQKKIVAIEWTTSGYRKLLGMDLQIPVLNMARSHTKLSIESPIIGLGIVQKIKEKYPKIFFSDKKSLVVGAGPIGLSVKKSLKDFKKNSDIVDLDFSLANTTNRYDLIVGCTGQNIFDDKALEEMNDVLLVSASSSDREFSAVEIRKKFPKNKNPHKEYVDGGITIANSGFPINFDGNIQFLPLEKIQITLAMVFASVCVCTNQSLEKGLNVFPIELDKEITDLFLSLPS